MALVTTALVMIGDGRDAYHTTSQASARLHLPPFDYARVINDHDHALGFSGAIRKAWTRVLATDAEYIFHLELDFVFLRRVPLAGMIRVLVEHPYLAQVALVRQPWSEEEKAAGGVASHAYQKHGGWLEHSRFFTTNPCVYPRWIAERGWPDPPGSEGAFGDQLMRDRPETRFAFWGNGETWVEHIGSERTGTGY